jgi:hypothetical protein
MLVGSHLTPPPASIGEGTGAQFCTEPLSSSRSLALCRTARFTSQIRVAFTRQLKLRKTAA